MSSLFKLDEAVASSSRIEECLCGKRASTTCSCCLVQRYCSKECQTEDWAKHRKQCVSAHVKEVVESFKNHGIYESCLPASLVLCTRLRRAGISAVVKNGFYVFPETVARHVWVENANGVMFDIGNKIRLALFPKQRTMQAGFQKSIKEGRVKLTEAKPHDLERKDMSPNNTDEERQSFKMFDQMLEQVKNCDDDEQYWKMAPQNIKDVRRCSLKPPSTSCSLCREVRDEAKLAL